VRRLTLLAGAVVFFDTLFFAALTPLLPHYAHELGLGKTGAGVLSGAYPAGAFVGAVPSGIVAARAGAKRTVLVGLTIVAVCTVAFGLGDRAWLLDTARFLQGGASAFSWTGAFSWLLAATAVERRGAAIGSAFATAVAGALFGPVLGAIAGVAGVGVTFTTVGVLSLGLVAWASTMPAERPAEPQPLAELGAALVDPPVAAAFWFVLFPALLFGVLDVLAPLRLAALGLGTVAIGAVFLCAAGLESVMNVGVGRLSDRVGTRLPIAVALCLSAVVAVLLPLPDRRLVLAALVILAAPVFGAFFTPGMTQLTHLAEARGLDYGYAFALVNLAWAPGQVLGAAGGGALAHAAGDTAPYLALAGLCALTLAAVWHWRESTAWTMRSAPASSGSSPPTTGAA